jgi:Concanavalin A-like lectin/glucanases superfamily
MNRYWLTAGTALALMGPGVASAQAQQGGTVALVTEDPQSIAFSGRNSLTFPGETGLNLSDVSTIEFWVRPTWQTIAYNPAILAALGATGPRYAIVMTADKQAIGLMSGTEWDFVEFDFDDGKPHHVAFVNQGDLTDVYIDGELHDTITQPIAEIPVLAFHIGSANGMANPFIGQLGEIRLWDTALDGDDVAAFMRLHILSEAGRAHPDLDDLIGVSDFARKRRAFTLMDNTSSAAELVDDVNVALGRAPASPPAEKPVRLPDGTLAEPLTKEERALFDAPVGPGQGQTAANGETQ